MYEQFEQYDVIPTHDMIEAGRTLEGEGEGLAWSERLRHHNIDASSGSEWLCMWVAQSTVTGAEPQSRQSATYYSYYYCQLDE